MGKGRRPCCDKNKVKKGPWTPAEDLKLISHIQEFGHPNWRALPPKAGLLRCGKSCRLRWINYLSPDVRRGNITLEEEETIINLHKEYGNKWSKIASHLPGRTDNEIKNVWNTHLKKKLESKDNNNKASYKGKCEKTSMASTPMSSSPSASPTLTPTTSTGSIGNKQHGELSDFPNRSIFTSSNASSIDQLDSRSQEEDNNLAETHDKLLFQNTPIDLDMEFWYMLEEGMGSLFSFEDAQKHQLNWEINS